MTSFNFGAFQQAFTSGVKDLAEQELSGFVDQATAAAESFLISAKKDISRWGQLLAKGELTVDEFQDLIEAKKAETMIHALAQKGIALASAQRLRDGIVNLLVSSAMSAIGV